MKRVLMVSCGGLGNGGVQAIMMGIIRNLSRDYYFDMLLFTEEVRYYDDEFLQYGGEIFRIPHYEGTSFLIRKIYASFRDFYIYRKFDKLLDTKAPYDIIHCNKQFESAPLLKAAAKHSIPVRICHTHVMAEKTGWLLSIFNCVRSSLIKKYSTHCLGCSKEACDSFYLKSVKSRVVPNFYDDSKFYFVDLPASSGNIVLTQLGAFSENKNQLFSLKVLKVLIDMSKSVILNLIGFDLEPGYKDKIKETIKELNLENNVIIHSGNTYSPQILKETNAFLMPSKHEGFGIALIEAQAMGVICFASDAIPQTTNCGGVTYLNVDKINSPYQWAMSICRKKELDGLRHERFDTSEFKLTRILELYKDIYNADNE